jgi:hypothetical protein
VRNYWPHTGFAQLSAESFAFVLGDDRIPPLVRGLGENLNRRGTDDLRAPRRGMDAALRGNVSTEEVIDVHGHCSRRGVMSRQLQLDTPWALGTFSRAVLPTPLP